MSPAPGRPLLPAALLLLGVGACLSLACYSIPAMSDADRERKRAAAQEAAEAEQKAEALRSLRPESMVASVAMIEAHLRRVLPPAALKSTSEKERLVVVRRAGFLIVPESYDITAVADFTAERTKAFVERVRLLHRNLTPRPDFMLHLRRDTDNGSEVVADFNFK